LATFFLVTFFLRGFFLAFFFRVDFLLTFLAVDLRRADPDRVARFFLAAAFLTGMVSGSKAEFEKRAIIHRPRPIGSLWTGE
jgi:hypothetical protein